ncbi:amidohydrolase [Cryobacterium breve]|uniref:Amidohydrolase n=1 Tax=Cryobacterium breve TaxID=1259258 RepID=A0ABY2J364_9MICO|nr:amidohydrolase family protein [Cryobacterium breve]TFC98325.1 amidohydrolase [Cryobacterium breve]
MDIRLGEPDSTGPSTVDAHHHLWDPAVRTYAWMDESVAPIVRRFDARDLAAASARTPVTKSVVVQATPDIEETHDLLDISSWQNMVAGVVGWIDLTQNDAADTLVGLKARPGQLVGIRHQVQDESDPAWLLRDDVLRGLKAVQDAGLVFELLMGRREAAAAIRLAELLPDLPLILDHAGKPSIHSGEGDSWRDWITRLASHEQVTCKLSGLVTQASWATWRSQPVESYALAVLDTFGAERALFGSDWPVCLLAASYDEVFELAARAASTLSMTERSALFGGTAARVYGLA